MLPKIIDIKEPEEKSAKEFLRWQKGLSRLPTQNDYAINVALFKDYK